MKKFLLIDGNHAIHRAFFSVPDTMTSPDKKVHTGAVHGFFQIMFKAVENLSPDSVIVCWDRGKPQHRKDSLPDYKAGRAPMDNHLREQFGIVKELLEVLGIQQYSLEGFEADDLLGTLATLNEANDNLSYIFSGDKDMFQLITEKTLVVSPKKGGELAVYDALRVQEEWGILPHQYVDFIGMKGDSSDNIKGIEGMGAKTAAKLIQEYNNLESVIAAALNDEISGKNGEKIKDQFESAMAAKDVATIHRDVPIDFYEEDITIWGDFDHDGVAEIFRYYGLNSVISRLKRHEGGYNPNKKADTYRDVIGNNSAKTTNIPDEQGTLF